MSSAIEAHQGVLVKGLGDGHMAAFRGAADAIGAAVEIQQAACREQLIVLRVGISAGDARAEGDDLFGTPVVEAARLCSAANGGQIVVAALVRQLAGTRGGYEFDPIGALSLKGLSDPVEACVVRWEPLTAVQLDRRSCRFLAALGSHGAVRVRGPRRPARAADRGVEDGHRGRSPCPSRPPRR